MYLDMMDFLLAACIRTWWIWSASRMYLDVMDWV